MGSADERLENGMKKEKLKRIFELAPQILVTVLFAVLIILTAAMISAFGKSSLASNSVPFDLDMITEKKSESSEIDGYLLPEFIGLGIDGENYGISVSSNIMSEIYGMLAPTLSHMISEENFKKADGTLWTELALLDEFVYVRYHSQLPDNVIGLFADASSGAEAENRNHILAYVYELMIIPAENKNGTVRVAVRSLDGEVALFESAAEMLDYEKLSSTVTSYRSGFSRFIFAGGMYALFDTEPIFTDSIAVREIVVSPDTGMFVFNNDSYKEPLMRLFAINPDKLLSEHEDAEGNLIYTDVHGVLTLKMSGFEYQSVSDGGVDIEKIIGNTEKTGLKEYIRASAEILSSIRAINKFFVGNDAEPILYSVASDGGRVRVTYEYALENIRIIGDAPAFTAEFENGKLKYAYVSAVAAKALISKVNSYSELWFVKSLGEGELPRNVSLVYEGDYNASLISAKWAAFVPFDK